MSIMIQAQTRILQDQNLLRVGPRGQTTQVDGKPALQARTEERNANFRTPFICKFLQQEYENESTKAGVL